MIEVKVCVGSSCHMKGSYQVITTFKQMIDSQGLGNRIALKASFCMGRCMQGISVTVDDEPIENVGFSNAAEIFTTQILPRVE